MLIVQIGVYIRGMKAMSLILNPSKYSILGVISECEEMKVLVEVHHNRGLLSELDPSHPISKA